MVWCAALGNEYGLMRSWCCAGDPFRAAKKTSENCVHNASLSSCQKYEEIVYFTLEFFRGLSDFGVRPNIAPRKTSSPNTTRH